MLLCVADTWYPVDFDPNNHSPASFSKLAGPASHERMKMSDAHFAISLAARLIPYNQVLTSEV